MAEPPSLSPAPPPGPAPAQDTTPVVVKKYANRRLYNTETSSYITLDNLADMIRAGRDFVVYDAKSGDDITRGVLTQIIVEEENKGSSMLPTAFLRQLIGFYGGSLQGVVPRYLEHAMASFARQQQQVRQMMQQTLSPFLPLGVEEMSRQNIAIFERAMSMFNPFHRTAETDEAAADPAVGGETPAERSVPSADPAEIERLRGEVESLKHPPPRPCLPRRATCSPTRRTSCRSPRPRARRASRCARINARSVSPARPVKPLSRPPVEFGQAQHRETGQRQDPPGELHRQPDRLSGRGRGQ
ncbi:MAG: hypothetical protein NVS2B11_11190 [Acetobacteraceae bacterium]